MKLARFAHPAGPRLALVAGGEMVDLAAYDPSLPASMTVLLASLDALRPRLEQAARSASRFPLGASALLAPVEEPRRFLAAGLNYHDHAREMHQEAPARPRLFTKLAGTLAGPHDAVIAPEFSPTLDYEGELACVIGRRCRNVRPEHAHEVIAGYMVLNDLSVREYVNPDLLVLGKGCAGFAPCGPWLTTADEIPDPQVLPIRTWVNDDPRQDSSTREMIFGCFELISRITRAVELDVGDLITTGSPAGCGAGYTPPRYLRPHDTVRVEIEGLGSLVNSIVPEPPP